MRYAIPFLTMSLFTLLCAAMLLIACQSAPQTTASGAAPAVMYQLQSIQTSWRWVEEAESPDGGVWELTQPPQSLDDCQPDDDPCGCAGVFRGTASIIFIPEQPMKIRWQRQSGTGGFYDNGELAEAPEGWIFSGATPAPQAECIVSGMNWNPFRRLLGVELSCTWESEDGTCKGEDRISVVFPENTPLLPPPAEELPWNATVEGETFRFGDDPASIPVPGMSDLSEEEAANLADKENAESSDTQTDPQAD
jgi:hypothetical protein